MTPATHLSNNINTQVKPYHHWHEFQKLKILYVGFYADIKTSSCNIYRDGFRAHNHQVDDFEYRILSQKMGINKMNQLLLEKAPNYDVIFIYKGEQISAHVLKQIGTKIILFHPDQRPQLERFILAMLPHVDLFVHTTGGPRLQAYHKHGKSKKSMFMFAPANIEVFKDLELERSVNILFTARKHPSHIEGPLRQQIKTYLKQRNDTSLYGEKEVILGDEYINAINQAKIGINVNHFYRFDKTSSNRLTDYLSCGLFTLCVYSKGLDELFIDKEDLVFFHNFAEFKSLLEYYLKHDQERQKIAQNGKRKIRTLYNNKILSQEILACLCQEDYVPKYNWIEVYKNKVQ